MGFPTNCMKKGTFVFSAYVTFLFCVEKQITLYTYVWGTIHSQMNGG